MNDFKKIKRIIKIKELNKGNCEERFTAYFLYFCGNLKVKVDNIFIGKGEYSLEGKFYEELPPLNLEEHQAFARGITTADPTMTISMSNLEFTHYFLIKENKKWKLDPNKQIERYAMDIDLKSSIEKIEQTVPNPRNLAAKINHNPKTGKKIKW